VVGGTVFMVLALNCSSCSLSLTHQPSAIPQRSQREAIL
jgi:hypothetical protein